MSTWRRRAQEQFPQYAAELEKWERTDWSSKLSDLFAGAVKGVDAEAVKSVVHYLSWCWSQRQSDEQFVHFVEYVLQQVLGRPAERAAFCSVVDPASFANIHAVYATFYGAREAELFEKEFRLRPF